MTDYAPPSRNPADNDTLTGLLKLVLTKALQNTADMLPARVIAYDRTTNCAQVQPLIAVVTTANQVVQRAQVASVPVFQYGGGGFVLSFPVMTGDTGWIKANDRDISLFKQTTAASSPNTARLHDFADAMFFPDTLLNGVTIATEDAANAVLQNFAGTVKWHCGAT
ncbi:Gp138 family membrane-puncturing spike protein [Fimbriiglobus ruber]|uniref:Phage-related protein n=1 Tax=Fimbriiglobus ruber TaxID=1908690 RepID=A0A225DKS1_9BACT|nr:Gp138 family membrane-puncturing spike protein [Fimbriiglobus ruber]OWK37005.1 Phage-related protein [Fimbriiglobus ruber]